MRKIIALAVLALWAAGCAAPAPEAPSQAKQEPAVSPSPARPAQGGVPAPVPEDVTLQITQAQAGQTVEVAVGQRFSVALVGVPTAGYLWAPATMPAFLTRAGETGGPTVPEQRQPGFTGGNHWEVFMFAATEAGQGDLVLHQRRPWESSEPPSQSFTVRIVAR